MLKARTVILLKENDLSHEKLLERARDELFSHVHRCGVLKAAEDDQVHWMDETIDYIGERYPIYRILIFEGYTTLGSVFASLP